MWTTLLTSFLFVSAAGAANSACRLVPQGPDGVDFYNPPAHLPEEPHGALIWYRPFNGSLTLSGGRNTLLLYTQEGVHGSQVATSGYLVVPDGEAPEGGWPIVTWAHGTTGIADQCAPTRIETETQINVGLLEDWVSKGYAVVQTDYEGLGTPGQHPYLIGDSEGRAVLDIIRAAKTYEPKLSNKVIISGHSQGGQAALFAAGLASKYTPELDVAATIAFAPVSGLEGEIPLLKALTITSLSGVVALILRGLTIGNSSIDVSSIMTPQAEALYPQTLTACSGALNSNSSFGGLPANELVNADANLDEVVAGLRENDAGHLRISTPVYILQGLSDMTVFPFTTTALVQGLKDNGAKVTIKTYPGATHSGVLVSGAEDATKYLVAALPPTK